MCDPRAERGPRGRRLKPALALLALAAGISGATISAAMFVVKRSGEKEEVKFDKITTRIATLCDGLNREFVDPVRGKRSSARAASAATLRAARGVPHRASNALEASRMN